jgi:hypothetical protein
MGKKIISFRERLKREPFIAQRRQEMADIYRKLRSDDPRMARLFYRRVRTAQEQMNQRALDIADRI